MGYLNNTGLSHFWDKLKQFFVKKSEVENAGISSITYTTVLASTTVTTALATGYRYPSAVLSSSVPTGFSQAHLYKITIGSAEKRMPCVLWFRKNNAGTGIQPIEFVGNPSYMLAEDVTSYFGHGDVDTTCGFCISARDIANDGARKLMLFTPTAGSYTVKIELENRDVTKFPPDLTFDNYNNPISEVANPNNSNSVSVGSNYMKHKTGTTSVGSGNTNSGANSTSVGVFNEASGQLSVAVGTQNKASGLYSLAVGNSNQSTGPASSAFGYFTESSGAFSTTNGQRTIANHKSQFVFGELNEPDPSEAAASARGTYVEIVGNGTSPALADRSNARTLDWNGNERLAGSLTLGAGTEDEKTITPEQLANTMQLAEYNTDEDVFQIRHAKAEKPSYNSEVVRKITGGTLAWNQLVKTPSGNEAITQNVTVTKDTTNEKFVVSGTVPSALYNYISWSGKTLQANRVYFIAYKLTSVSGEVPTIAWAKADNTATSLSRTFEGSGYYYFIGKNPATVRGNFIIGASFASGSTGNSFSLEFSDVQLIDLGLAFGSTIADRIYALEQATAGAGVAWFRRYFNLNYYEHNQTLANTYFDQYETTGFNQYDGVPTIGKYWSNGTLASMGSNARFAATENKVRCIPNAVYCVSFPNAVKTHDRVVVTSFDADGNFLRIAYSDVATASKYVFTTDSDCHMFAISFYTDSSTFANGDFDSFCINLSDASRNGQYEPYRHSRITFFDNPVLLRGIPYLDENDNLRFNGDTLEAPGKINRRYQRIKLDGTNVTAQSMAQSSSNSVWYTVFDIHSFGYGPGINSQGAMRMMNDKGYREYPGVAVGNYYVTNVGKYIVVCFFDQTLTTPSAVNTYLQSNPIDIVYELATPTEEEFTPIDGPLVSDPLGMEVIAKSDWDDTPTLAQMDILYANEVRANVEMIATNKVVAMRRAITTKRGMPGASAIDLNTFCTYGEYDISLSTVSNAPPDVTGLKLIVQSTVADTETAGGQHPHDTIQIFIGHDTDGIVKIFTRLYLRTSQNIKYWSSWSSSGPAPILELSNCSWQGDEVQASISNMSVYDIDGMDVLAIKVPCVEGGDYEDDAFICLKAYDSILNNDRLIFTSVPDSDGRYLQLTLESNNTGTTVLGDIMNIHDVLVYNITFDSQGEANQPISFSSALALLLSGKMIVLKAGGTYYYPAYNVTSNTNYIRFATTLDDSGYWNCCMWSSSTGKISTEEYNFMGMVYTGYSRQFIPSGGTTGQFLVKNSNANYDVGWVTVPNANGVSF